MEDRDRKPAPVGDCEIEVQANGASMRVKSRIRERIVR